MTSFISSVIASGRIANCGYSLRSVARFLPWVRKVWIFGDRPEWLAEEASIVEHVPHEYLSRPWGLKLPVRNNFWLTFLASLIPGLSQDYLWFADDYILLRPVEPAEMFQIRAMEDLATVATRGRGKWKDALWRTHDTLAGLGYGSLNFECHVPHPLNRRLMWEVFCEFQDFVTEDRFYGLLVHTAAFRYAMRQRKENPQSPACNWPLVFLKEEGKYVGFHNSAPTLAEVRTKSQGKSFLNFDDAAYSPGMQDFLAEQFPEPSKFER